MVNINGPQRVRMAEDRRYRVWRIGRPHADSTIGVATAQHSIVWVLAHHLQAPFVSWSSDHLLAQGDVQPGKKSFLTLESQERMKLNHHQALEELSRIMKNLKAKVQLFHLISNILQYL